MSPFKNDRRDEPSLAFAGAGEGTDGTGGRSTPSSSGIELAMPLTVTGKTCTVALSLDTARHLESEEKAMQWMSALSLPLLSCNK